MSGVSVRGGMGGIEAHCDDLVATARHFGRAAGDTGEQAAVLHGYLVHPEVLASATLDPVGAAAFEGTLLDALDGVHGVTVLAARCATLDAALRGAAAAYLAADRLDEAVAPEISALVRLPRAIADAQVHLTRGDVAGAGNAFLGDDPALVDVTLDAVAGATHLPLRADALLLGDLYADGRPVVTSLGADPTDDAGGPPRSLADVMGGLARRDRGQSGEVDVRVLDGPGPRKVIVDIPGTKDWSVLARHNADVTSPVTNLRALAGETTTYERGVFDALRRAGVRPDDDVLLVGHSQGGMVAVNAANRAARTREYHIAHVVTAGSPIGAVAGKVPRSVQVLALENDGDVVPHLDGADNPDRVNVITATVHHRQRAVLASHSLDAGYVPGARDVDASDDPSVRAYLGGLSGFFAARTVHTTAYRITRGY